MDLHHLTLTLNRSDTTLTGRGEYLVEIPATPDNPPPPVQVLFSKPLTIAGRIDIDAETENHWRLKTAASAEKQGIFCRLFTSRVAAKLPRIQIDLAATPDDIDVDFDLLLSDVSVSSASFDIRSPRLSLKGSTRRPVTADGALSSDFNLTVRETTLTSPSAVADVAISELQGRWRHGGKAPPTFDGEIGFSGATIRVPALKLIVPDALGRLPLQWPPKKSARPGRFRAPTIEFVGRNIGELTTELMQTTAGITFRGSHASRVIPTVSLDFEGRADLVPQTPVHFSMRYRFKRPAEGSPIDLGALHPGAGGILLSGGISGGGQLEYGSRGLGGTFESEIEKGTLRFSDSDAVVEGIHMALSLPDLPQLRSSGHQQMTFARASFGKVHISDASVHFQVESQRSLWLEKGHFKWCDGRVDVQDLHLAPDIDDYHLVLYCDRLNLAQVLEQFGAANAEGRGALNGRLPLSIRKGNIRFEDGFLYSTPGDGGKLRITDTDILTAGVPRDTPQYAQLALAREALKNYDYTWAKISLNTEDETLMLRMQMDGKPADLLPFQFDRELGGFARVEGEGAGARFQGIRLDVNFKLPLNQIMRHWKLIRMIQ
jgi:hypothetical protein